MNLKIYNDYELVELAQDGNEDAISTIYKKYSPIIYNKCKHALSFVSHHGIDINDLTQEAFIGLNEAIYQFSQDNQASFYTFALVCINRKIYNFVRRLCSSKDSLFNEAIALDDNIEKSIPDSNINIEHDFVFKSEYNDIVNKLNCCLSEFELDVFKLRVIGYKFDEIAILLNKDIKSVYSTFNRVKLKISKIAKEDN